MFKEIKAQVRKLKGLSPIDATKVEDDKLVDIEIELHIGNKKELQQREDEINQYENDVFDAGIAIEKSTTVGEFAVVSRTDGSVFYITDNRAEALFVAGGLTRVPQPVDVRTRLIERADTSPSRQIPVCHHQELASVIAAFAEKGYTIHATDVEPTSYSRDIVGHMTPLQNIPVTEWVTAYTRIYTLTKDGEVCFKVEALGDVLIYASKFSGVNFSENARRMLGTMSLLRH